MPGSVTSTVKRAAPVTFARPFERGTGLPITLSSAFGGSGGASSGRHAALDFAQADAGDADWIVFAYAKNPS